jgi:hypothetical protein
MTELYSIELIQSTMLKYVASTLSHLATYIANKFFLRLVNFDKDFVLLLQSQLNRISGFCFKDIVCLLLHFF